MYGAFLGVKGFVNSGAAISVQHYYFREEWEDDLTVTQYGALAGFSIFIG